VLAGCSDLWSCPADCAPNDRRRPLVYEVPTLSSEEIQVCTSRKMRCACSAKIVKRRLIWRLPGVGFYPMSEAGSNDVVDGLAGRIRKRDRNR